MGAADQAAILEFDEASHTYTYQGRKVPSVTTILKPAYDWSGIPEHLLAAKSALGTAVHYATELDDAGDLFEESVHPLVRPYLDAYRLWRRDMGVEVLSSEQRVYHPLLGYAGTYDVKARIAGRKWLIDKKCTSTVSPVWSLQTAAYREADPERASLTPAALHLKPDGRYTWLPYDKPENRGDFGVFAGLASFHHWRTAKRV